MNFDLLSTVEYGGCSAKLPPDALAGALSGLLPPGNKNLLVGISTHDDAGVYKLTDDLALIQTTDFFPPVCSDPYTFGKIAAANALSDVYAMGGTVITAMNLVMFPSQKIPLEVLREILRGGQEKVQEAGGVIAGGHTIDDYPPKYGLAVSGIVHPDRIIRNDRAVPGDVLILTKPLGTGTLVAGQRCGEAREEDYRTALVCMETLNRTASEIMQKFDVRCATDITGFGLLGHALNMARGSGASIRFDSTSLPLLSGAYELIDLGCIPGAAFRNLRHVEAHCRFGGALDYNLKMLMTDAQTSGGMLICAPSHRAEEMLAALHQSGCDQSTVIGTVIPPDGPALRIY
ncbi:MAG: selenide, water dikinase SelD [Pontiellaceae bacterium]|nr:selenide, water dikinase SelD [Pontiellaceae bacterium]